MPEPKFITISGDHEDGEPLGVIWAQDSNELIPADWLGEQVKTYVDELADGESLTLTFTRTDMTRAQIDAIPEV